jgi:hypothetical protein
MRTAQAPVQEVLTRHNVAADRHWEKFMVATKPKSEPKRPQVEDIPTFLTSVFMLKNAPGVTCYRGENNSGWDLKPSVMRDLKPEAERQIFSELMVESPTEFSGDKSMFEKLVRAQHYGLPTRLLDVSMNPLVALYFACNEKERVNEDGQVIIMDSRQSASSSRIATR